MTRGFALSAALAGALAIVLAVPASAQEFFGEDVQGSTANSANAESLFLSYLSGTGTETFESQAAGTTVPIGLTFPGAGTATLTGTGTVDNSPCCGRYAISGSQFLEVDGANFQILFSDPVAAFGFYGIDVGDFGSSLTLNFYSNSTLIRSRLVPQTATSTGEGGLFYYGWIDSGNPWNEIRFGTTSSSDVLGFEDMTIGSVQQVAPEPMSMLLLGTGLLGVAGAARRRREDEA